jgi:hypothetical protein
LRMTHKRHGQHSIDLYFETGFSPCEEASAHHLPISRRL